MHGTRSKESLYRREFLNLAGLVPVGWAASSLANLWADGTVIGEGSYVDGKKHGHWIMRFVLEDECVMEEGLYVHGKKHGHWVFRWEDGTVWEGPYVDDQEHGDWVERRADGTVYEFSYMDGELVSAVRRE